MKKNTLNHMAMYQNVLAVANNHQNSWNQVPGIVTVVNQFEAGVNNLSSKLKAQNQLTKGIRLEKDSFMTGFVERMSTMKKGLFLYSKQSQDLSLRERNNEPKSTLRSMSANRLEVITSSLLEDLDTYGNALTNVGISNEQIQEFRDQAVQFGERKNSVRQAIIDRSIETKAISELEKQLNALLIGELDRYISLLSITDANFFAEYKAARKIIGNGGGSKNHSQVV